MIDLAHETALITGASRGIGAEIAKVFGSRGCKIAVNYLQNKEKAEEGVSAINQSGGKAAAYQADVTDADQVHRMVESIAVDLGQPVILVNNASSPIISKKLSKTEWNAFLLLSDLMAVALTPVVEQVPLRHPHPTVDVLVEF